MCNKFEAAVCAKFLRPVDIQSEITLMTVRSIWRQLFINIFIVY